LGERKSLKIVSVAVAMLLFISVLMLTVNIKANAPYNGVYLFVTPPMHVAEEIGELFDIAINISSVENLQSVGFTIMYNTSLLDVAQVVQGPFFPLPPRSYFEFEKNESAGFIKVNISLADSETPRSGNGALAWISFKVVQAASSCVSSPLALEQSLLLNSELIPIVHDSVSAVYFWKSMQPDPPGEGRLLDLYTQKAGEGPNELGGEFKVGELVHLISQVTYNDNSLQQKLVAFEVRNPLNESVAFRTAITDQDGLAAISFRIPDIPSSNGIWAAISVVDIAGKVVWDTISFRVYLIMPVGGYSFSMEEYATEKPLTIYLLLLAIVTAVFTVIKSKTPKKLGRHSCVCTIFTLMMLSSLLTFSVRFQTSKGGDVRITDFYSCDALGIPQDYFPKKTTAYFNISVRNLAQDPKNISIYLTVQDELNVPIGTDQFNTTIPQNASTYHIISVFLPKWAYVGFATTYASLWEKGNPIDSKTIQFYIGPEDLTPPVIHILSPENATYVTRPFPLVFTIDERTTWIGYNLNGLENVTIGGNTTLAGLNIGSYRIMVYANDTSGNVGSSEEICFTVLNRPPIAYFTESATTVPTGTIINFNASSSYDPDGHIVDYFWDFGDGANGSSVTTEHAYADNGTYTVTLTITDNDGSTATVTANKTVLNRKPIALFIESVETALTGTVINFNASDSFDPDGSIVAYAWDFGDGNFGSSVLVDHSYIDDGVHNVTLTVTDNDGASSMTSALKTILDRPPVANFSETVETVYIDELINFNASTSYDPDGTIVAYFWDFGDGKNATGVTVNHAYEHNGTYTVTLTITDDDGMSASTSTIKNILNRPDIAVSNVSPYKTVLGQGYSLKINVTVTNSGDRVETFDVTIYAGANSIATQAITLTTGNFRITFTWNTTGFAYGYYTISAYAWPLIGELNTTDNMFINDVPVHIGVPGDVSGPISGVPDGIVDIRDINYLVQLFMTRPKSLNWNPNADINGDLVVNIRDIYIVVQNFMK
jgi:PKD repeat protein